MQEAACDGQETGAPQAVGRSFGQINSRLFTIMGSAYCFTTLMMQVRSPYSGIAVVLLEHPSLFDFDFEI